MGEFAGRMIRTAILSLLEGDARLADAVREMDDEIDRMNRRAHADLLKLIQEKPQYTQQAMNGMMVVTQSGAHCRSRLQHRHRRHLLDSRRRCAPPVEHVDGLRAAARCK